MSKTYFFNFIIKLFYYLAVILFFLAIFYLLISFGLFDVKKVSIDSEHTDLVRVDNNKVNNIIKDNINGNIFQVNLYKLKQDLLQAPWVDDVILKKIWPSKIYIKIIEEEPIARWDNENLIDINGKIFKVKTDEFFPKYEGDKESFNNLIEIYKVISKLFPSKADIKVNKIVSTKSSSWNLIIDDDIIVIIGRKDWYPRLLNLVIAWNKDLKDKKNNIEYIDLRYQSGLAVKFKE